MKKTLLLSLLVAVGLLVLGRPSLADASQVVVKKQPLSPGVTWQKYDYRAAYKHEINHISIDLNHPYASIDIGLPATYGGKSKTTTLATNDSRGDHRVVGAINAAFYHMNSGFPIYLLAKENEIYNSGILSDSADAFVSHPIAFGVTASGQAEIDYFTTKFEAQLPSQTLIVDGVNRQRDVNELIVYTPQHHSPYTLTNEFGVEYIFESDGPITSTQFGQQLRGKVIGIYPYGSQGKREIPRNGFALSGTRDKGNALQSLEMGQEVTVTLGIDAKWQDAKFMLASGPMLVKDGKVHLTMNPNSSRAKGYAARSAIAISKDKKQAHFITVDATSTSKGMTLTQFAQYIASLGYDRALNLDGGGSTTMGYRPYGTHVIQLANRPSDKSERAVSAILEAVSTAPLGEAKTIGYSRTYSDGTTLVGVPSTVNVQYVIDEYYNPLPVAQVSLRPTTAGVAVNGLQVTPTAAGVHTVEVLHGERVVDTFTMNVVDAPATLQVSPAALKVKPGQAVTLKVTALDAANRPLTYLPQQVKWVTSQEMGTVTGNGQFVASAEGGKTGEMTVSLGSKTVSIPIEIEKEASFAFADISIDYLYLKELAFLVDNGIMTGYEDKTFRPQDSLKRDHAMVILSRLLKLDTSNVKDPGFVDVPKSHLYYREIAAVANAGIVSGKDGGKYFAPNDTITRAQMAKILVEAFELSGQGNKAFKDLPSSDWAYSYVQTLVANGVANGYEDGTFRPNEPIQRIHFGRFLYNVSE